jgi:hypothetical protein
MNPLADRVHSGEYRTTRRFGTIADVIALV